MLSGGLKPYRAYKDSGVPWLGAIPAHWEVRRQRSVVDLRVSNVDKHAVDGQVPVRLCNYVDVYKNQRIRGDLRFVQATARADEVERFRLHSGDVIITKDSEMWTDIGVPALTQYEAPDLVCGYHLAILRSRSGVMIGDYLFRATQSQGVALQYHVSANGVTRYGLSHDAIKRAVLPVPPVLEQRAIARYLDYIDHRICRYIRAKQGLAKLLEEQRQAIVDRVITRGLDPQVERRPSGVDWLGHVPRTWEVMKLSRVIAEGPRNGISPAPGEAGTVESFSIAAIRNGVVDIRDQDKKNVSGDRLALERVYSLIAGDVLLVRGNGNVHLVGKAGLVESDMPGRVYPDLLMRVRVNGRCLPRFLVLLLNCQVGRTQIETAARTAVGSFKINNEQVRQFRFAFPPIAEQQGILDQLSRGFYSLEAAISDALGEISLLREYRTRLIADVVTGKVDVREAADSLPDELADWWSPEDLAGADDPDYSTAFDVDDEAPIEDCAEEDA